MKVLRFLLVVSLILVSSLGYTITNEVEHLSPELTALKSACQVLANKPQNEESLDVLFQYAKDTNSVDRLRSRAMAAFALATLFKGDTNLFFRAQESHALKYPDDKNLLRVDLRSCYSVCEACQGKGRDFTDCSRCKGKGVCPTCRGKGFALARKNLHGTSETGLRCSVCKGSGKCPSCDGAGKEIRRCPECKGRPAPFEVSQEIYQDFVTIIKGMSKWIDNEEVFYQRYQQAKDEQDLKKRKFLLSALIDDYTYRPEITDVKLLLATILEELREQSQVESANAEKARQELAVLKNLQKTENLSGAIITLNDYLTANPDTENRLELESILNQLVDKLKSQKRRRTLYYSLGGIFLLLFGLSCIQINQYKYTIFTRVKKLED